VTDTNDHPTTLTVNDDRPVPAHPATTVEADRAAVLEIHKKWWKANVGLDIPRMVECFPAGDSFTMFNRNSFTYFGIEELTRLWQWFRDTDAPPRITQTVSVMRLEVRGDTAWLACELTYRRVAAEEERHWEVLDGDTFGSKATEIYQRDDGNGNPEWKMWHFQSAALQPFDAPRPSGGATLRERGLGAGWVSDPFVYTTTLDEASQ
jgi:hypothetical protein